MEEDAISAEEKSQIAYETFVTETNAAIDAATKESITSAETKAKAQAEKAETELARDGVVSEIEALIGENADLHKSCDYTPATDVLRCLEWHRGPDGMGHQREHYAQVA